jgi:hypothetical protein
MKKRMALTVLLVLAAFGAAYTQTTVQRSLYVSAKGDDNNNGRSEETPFKTLGKATEAANAGVIKTITVIGTIDSGSVHQRGDDEIMVTGKPGASEAEKAVINSVIGVIGKVRFTHIRLGGIEGYGNVAVTLGAGVVVTNPKGTGVRVRQMLMLIIMTDDATITGCRDEGVGRGEYFGVDSVTMSGNASITNNGGTGINGAKNVTMSGNAKISNNKERGVNNGKLTMSENAEISGNVSTGNGGGAYVNEGLAMSGNAKIINNTAEGNGGGVYIDGGSITISDNALISGNTAKEGGGIYLNRGSLTMEGGEISGNKAENGAGVYMKGPFNHKGGTITGNNAEYVGGGVYVMKGGTYTAGGGAVSGNTAGDGGENLFRQ